MSALAVFLKQARTHRNWTVVEFAQRADLTETTLLRILNDEIVEVKGSQISQIAKALGMPFWELMQIAGYTLGTPGDPSDEQRRIATIIAADPGLQPVMEKISRLNADDRRAVLAYIELLQQQRTDPQ